MSAQIQIRFEKVATERGSYWRSDAAYRAILGHLRKMAHDGHWKAAALGGGVEEGFEQAFSSLAYAYLKDKAPRLLDFMVGFQLVDRNEDNTKAVGIFGFKVGDQWLYAPVFFLNGDLKGHELLYIKKQDSFVPMKENWVNYLMSRRPHVLGEHSEQDTFEMGGLMPDVYSLSSRPNVGIGKRSADLLPGGVGDNKPDDAFNPKSLAKGIKEEHEHTNNSAVAKEIAKDHLTEDAGAYKKAHIDDWAKPAMPMLAAMQLKWASALYRTAKPRTKLAFDQVVAHPFQAALAEEAPRLDLGSVLSTSFPLLKTSFDLAQRYPAIKRGFDRFYGSDCFSRWAQQLRERQMSATMNIMPTVKRAAAKPRPQFRGDSLIPEAVLPEHPIKRGALEIRVLEDVSVTQNLDDLDDAEREKLLKDTVLIKDKRDPHSGEASKAYNTQVEQKLTNPHETGLYEVLEKPGNFERMLVISNPLSNEGQKDFCTLVRLGDGSKSWLNAHRTTLWADKVELREDYDKWFDGLGDKDSLTKGGIYLAINQAGNGTVPFEVTESYGDGAYRVNFKSHCDYSYRRADGLGRTSDGCGVQAACCGGDYVSAWGAKLYVDAEGRRGTKLRAIQGELRVPANFKFLKLKDPPKPKKDKDGFLMPSVSEDSGSEDRPILPGKLEDIQLMFTEKTAAMKVWGDHHEVTIRTKWAGDQRLRARDALISLVGDHGLTEKTAREILARAGRLGAVSYRVEFAPGFGDKRHMTKTAFGNNSILEGGPSAPPEMPPEVGMEMYGNRTSSRAMYPDEQHNLVPELDSSMVDPSHQDQWRNYTYEDFQNTMGQAQQAAQSGQKEVFDTAMISGMLKSVRQDSLVDRYLGDLLKALDKLGRILFMFYWHQEEFEDRYGKQDLPELEDSLRNAFETLGDVTLFLKEKTVEPSFEAQESEPEVEEAARI